MMPRIATFLTFVWGLLMGGLVFPDTASGDDVGMTNARLIERGEDSVYVVEADVAPAMIGAILPPIFPDRFEVTQRPTLLRRGTFVTVRYEASPATENAEALNGTDRLLLPWARAGVLLEVFLSDASPQRGVFPATGPEGIPVDFQNFRPIERNATTDAIDRFLQGFHHARNHWVHLVLVASFALAARGAGILRLTLVFAAGHALSMVALDLRVPAIPAGLEHALLALGAMLITREALLSTEARLRGIQWLILVLGLTGGLGNIGVLAGIGSLSVANLFAFNTGVDAWHFLLAGCFLILWAAIQRIDENGRQIRRWLGCALGGASAALLMVGFHSALAESDRGANGGDAAFASARFDFTGPRNRNANSGASAATAPRQMTEPMLVYLTLEPNEIRLEMLARASLFGWGSSSGVEIPVEVQASGREGVLNRMAGAVSVRIDGEERAADDRLADFVDVLPTGVRVRETPKVENKEEAVLGISWVWETAGFPEAVAMTVDLATLNLPEVPVTIVESTGSRQVQLTPDDPSLSWKNEDAIQQSTDIQAIPVDLPRWPLLSIVLVALSGVLFAMNRRASKASAIVVLVGAILLYPFVRTTAGASLFPLASPPRQELKVLLQDVLFNLYRALGYRNESVMYDQLALSVSGEELTEAYLQLRRALELENRGGARARVDQLEIVDIASVKPDGKGGLAVQVQWRASGSARHFGHTHYRQNAYEAILHLAPVDGSWKITDIEVLDERRTL